MFSAAIFAVPMYRRFRTLEGKQRSYAVFMDLRNHFLATIPSMHICFLIATLAIADKIERTAEVAIEVIEGGRGDGEGRRRGCGRVPRQ